VTAIEWRTHALAARGFMPEDEGDALHAAALAAARAVPGAPLVEIGSWCGKSSVYLGAAARERGTVLFAVDHHRGSEENQPGWEHHDPTLVDPRTGTLDTLPTFRRTVWRAGLEGVVIGVVGDSPMVAAHWSKPCALVFIDGGHGEEPAFADYRPSGRSRPGPRRSSTAWCLGRTTSCPSSRTRRWTVPSCCPSGR
jgi:hypothetical protein